MTELDDARGELLACPFCGTQPHSHADYIQHNADDPPWNGQWIIECNACPVDSSTWGATKDKATAQWNTRPAPVPQCEAEPVGYRWKISLDQKNWIWSEALPVSTPCFCCEPLYAAPARCDAENADAQVSALDAVRDTEEADISFLLCKLGLQLGSTADRNIVRSFRKQIIQVAVASADRGTP